MLLLSELHTTSECASHSQANINLTAATPTHNPHTQPHRHQVRKGVQQGDVQVGRGRQLEVCLHKGRQVVEDAGGALNVCVKNEERVRKLV